MDILFLHKSISFSKQFKFTRSFSETKRKNNDSVKICKIFYFLFFMVYFILVEFPTKKFHIFVANIKTIMKLIIKMLFNA